MKCLHRYLPPFSLDIDMVRICPTKLVNWFIRASHTHPHAENGSAYCIVRPTRLDKIKNLHAEVPAVGVGSTTAKGGSAA